MNLSFEKRERYIPINSQEYTKVFLLGTTGGGKTTLLRQLMHLKNFPSTSTSRTTIHDIEIVNEAVEEYEAIVTFISKSETQKLVEECVQAAILEYLVSGNGHKMMRLFLTHKNSRFRLNYVLGQFDRPLEIEDDEDEDRNDNTDSTIQADIDRKAIQETLISYKERLILLSNTAFNNVRLFFDLDVKDAIKNDKETIIELIEENLLRDNNFVAFVDDILLEIRSKFNSISKGKIIDTEDWIDYWHFNTSDKEQLITELNRFSGNLAANFGALLTPLVDGIRVKGNFNPENDKLVLIDGEGLSHTTDSTYSISERVSQKIHMVDAIILVDNAAQPMLHAPISALINLATMGYESKLAIAFTHFDQVKGANFANIQDKKDHINNIIENALVNVEKEISKGANKSLRKIIDCSTFFLANIQESELKNNTKKEIKQLITCIENKKIITKTQNVQIHFDSTFLIENITEATRVFHTLWENYLGFSPTPTKYPKQHWATIKAFTRRLAEFNQTEYYGLAPVANLTYELNKTIRMFLENNAHSHSNEDDTKNKIISLIMNEISKKIQEYVVQEMINLKRIEWENAYNHSGRGSSYDRATDIKNIYNLTTFDPYNEGVLWKSSYIKAIRQIIAQVIEDKQCILF